MPTLPRLEAGLGGKSGFTGPTSSRMRNLSFPDHSGLIHMFCWKYWGNTPMSLTIVKKLPQQGLEAVPFLWFS